MVKCKLQLKRGVHAPPTPFFCRVFTWCLLDGFSTAGAQRKLETTIYAMKCVIGKLFFLKLQEPVVRYGRTG